MRELTTHFNSLAVLNRKNLFFYFYSPYYYYMRFAEDALPPPSINYVDDSLCLSESNSAFHPPPPSPSIPNQNNQTLSNARKTRQRHDSVRYCSKVHCLNDYGFYNS